MFNLPSGDTVFLQSSFPNLNGLLGGFPDGKIGKTLNAWRIISQRVWKERQRGNGIKYNDKGVD